MVLAKKPARDAHPGADVAPLAEQRGADATPLAAVQEPTPAQEKKDKEDPDDGRIAKYLASRGIPEGLIPNLGLELSRSPRGSLGKRGKVEPGLFGMIAWATDEAGEKLAGQILTLRENATPIIIAGPVDKKTGQPKPRKERLTWAPRSGWNKSAAWRLPAELGNENDPMVLCEGVETEEQRILLRLAGCDEAEHRQAEPAGRHSRNRDRPSLAAAVLVLLLAVDVPLFL